MSAMEFRRTTSVLTVWGRSLKLTKLLTVSEGAKKRRAQTDSRPFAQNCTGMDTEPKDVHFAAY